MMMTPHWLQRSIDALERSPLSDRGATLVEPVARVVNTGARGSALRGEWLGHALHPLLTDLSLGCWIGAGLLDVAGGKRSRVAAQRLVGAGLLFVPPVAASGMADYAVVDDRRVKRVGAVHAVGNIAVAGLYANSWWRRRQGRHASGVASAMLGGAMAWVTGYLGGHMSFARGAGSGERGLTLSPGSQGTVATGVDESTTVDIEGAARLLDVQPEQVAAMVAGDMLVPAAGDGAQMRFRHADVLAVRVVGS